MYKNHSSEVHTVYRQFSSTIKVKVMKSGHSKCLLLKMWIFINIPTPEDRWSSWKDLTTAESLGATNCQLKRHFSPSDFLFAPKTRGPFRIIPSTQVKAKAWAYCRVLSVGPFILKMSHYWTLYSFTLSTRDEMDTWVFFTFFKTNWTPFHAEILVSPLSVAQC